MTGRGLKPNLLSARLLLALRSSMIKSPCKKRGSESGSIDTGTGIVQITRDLPREAAGALDIFSDRLDFNSAQTGRESAKRFLFGCCVEPVLD